MGILKEVEESLSKHKRQARQLDPRAVVVPYERVLKVLRKVVDYYEVKKN